MKTLSIVSNALFIFEILLLILGQLGRISLSNGISFYILEAVISLHTLIYLSNNLFVIAKSKAVPVVSLPNPWQSLVTKRFHLLGVFWLLLCVLVLSFQFQEFSVAENIRAFGYLFRVANFALFAHIVAPNISKKMVKNTLDALSLVLPLLALAQYVFLPDLRFLAEYGWDPHMYRAVGTILDPPIMGSVLGMLLINKIIRIEKYKNIISKKFEFESIKNILFSNVDSMLLYFSIIFLYSRSTYLAVFFAANYFYFVKKKYFLLLFFSIFFLLSIYLAPQTIPAYRQLESAKLERLSTVTSRKTEILAGLDAFAKNPVWGIGYNRVREYKEKLTVESEQGTSSINNPNRLVKSIKYQVSSIKSANHAGSAYHSFWVTQLATTGVVGFGLLLWFFVKVIRKKPQFAAILFVPAFIGLFDNTLFHPFVMITMVILYFGCQSKAQPTT